MGNAIINAAMASGLAGNAVMAGAIGIEALTHGAGFIGPAMAASPFLGAAAGVLGALRANDTDPGRVKTAIGIEGAGLAAHVGVGLLGAASFNRPLPSWVAGRVGAPTMEQAANANLEKLVGGLNHWADKMIAGNQAFPEGLPGVGNLIKKVGVSTLKGFSKASPVVKGFVGGMMLVEGAQKVAELAMVGSQFLGSGSRHNSTIGANRIIR